MIEGLPGNGPGEALTRGDSQGAGQLVLHQLDAGDPAGWRCFVVRLFLGRSLGFFWRNVQPAPGVISADSDSDDQQDQYEPPYHGAIPSIGDSQTARGQSPSPRSYSRSS